MPVPSSISSFFAPSPRPRDLLAQPKYPRALGSSARAYQDEIEAKTETAPVAAKELQRSEVGSQPVAGGRSATRPAQRHLFIVGFFRSGTTLLYSFLNLHPEVKLLFEADILNHSLVNVSIGTGKNWWERLDFYNGFCRRHRLTPKPSWRAAGSARQVAETLYQEYGGERLYVGEKSPSYYNCIPELARQFPEARFIVIWRNPLKVLSSISDAGKKHHFFLNGSLPLRFILGLEKMQDDVLALRAQGTAVHDLSFESLVENPEKQLTSICNFLEIPFDPAMLNLDRADCSMYPPGEIHTKAKSGQVLKSAGTSEAPKGPLHFKTQAYLHRWKQRFGDRLATKSYWPDAGATAPGAAELIQDRSAYTLARFFSERFTPIVYGSVPLSWLQFYRARREKIVAPFKAGTPGASRVAAHRPLKISVVTPSYKQLPWLRLCAASVADQQGVSVEHIIQDAQSGEELENWVRDHTKADLYIECDSGMYDAINRGFARATGDIVCWLNSDEQYLEGTLAKVACYFECHPEIDVLFGDALLISNTGALLSYRRTVLPEVGHIQAAHLNTLSCATFIRRSVLEQGFTLDTQWKAIADAVWVVSLLRAGISTAVLNEPLSAFTITDSNLGQTSLAHSETAAWQGEKPIKNFWLRPFFVARYWLTKLLRGAYWPRAVTTSLYTLASPEKRVCQHVDRVGFSWPRV